MYKHRYSDESTKNVNFSVTEIHVETSSSVYKKKEYKR